MAEEKKLIRYEDVYRYAFDRVHGGGLEDEEFDAIINAIDSVDAVDAVEVVRCEKCLYRSQYSDENGCYKCGGLQTEDGDLVLMVKSDFFCSYGERKDNERKAD